MRCATSTLLLFTSIISTLGKIDSQEDSRDSDDRIENSEEHIGASVTQVVRHPYAASLLDNDTYVCSAVVLNAYWLLTLSKCFDSKVISSYVTYKNLGNYTLRCGSSYNNKGGTFSKIRMLVNHFDFKVSAIKLLDSLTFNSQTAAVNLPYADEEATLGYLANIIAWTPTGHMRIVNVPIIEPSICEPDKLLPGHYVCVGGVQDPNRHFCRRDNGGAVIQNNTLIAITSFLHTCALYTKTHAFPKISKLARWLDSNIWDENNRPTTTVSPTSAFVGGASSSTESERNIYMDPQKYMLTLPFDPVNVPIVPAEDNSVIPRMSMYESYLQSLARSRTSTTSNPSTEGPADEEWLQKYRTALQMMPPQMIAGKYNQYKYNN